MVAKYPNGNAKRAQPVRPTRPPKSPADFQKGKPPGKPANDNTKSLPRVPKSVLQRIGALASASPFWRAYEAIRKLEGFLANMTIPGTYVLDRVCTKGTPFKYTRSTTSLCSAANQATWDSGSLLYVQAPASTQFILRFPANPTHYVSGFARYNNIDVWKNIGSQPSLPPRPGINPVAPPASPPAFPLPGPMHWPIHWPNPSAPPPPRRKERPDDNQEPGKGPDDDKEDRRDNDPRRNPRRRPRPRRRDQYDLPPSPAMPPVIRPPGIDLPIVPPDLDFEIPIGSNPLNPPKIEWKPSRGDGSRPPSRRKHERKVNVAAVGGIVWTGFNAATEVMDFIEAMHDALPKHKQAKGNKGKPPSKTDKINHIVSHPEYWGEINVAEAVQNVINNQIEDFVAAIGSKPIKRVTQEIGSATGLDRAIRSGSEPWSKGGPTIPELDIDTATGEVTITVKVGGYSKRVW